MPERMPRVVLVAALDRGHAIGRGNQLPWHLPEDLKRFKALTLGKPILMGRRTAESLGRALPKRRNLVLTRNGSAPFADMLPVPSIDAALAASADAADLMVIGGGEVFSAMLPMATAMHLTWVDARIEDADALQAFGMRAARLDVEHEELAIEQHVLAGEEALDLRIDGDAGFLPQQVRHGYGSSGSDASLL